MGRAYRYLFYRFYSLAPKGPWNNRPQINAFFFMTLVGWMHALILVDLVQLEFGISLVDRLSDLNAVLFAALLAIPQYFALLFRKRYLGVIREFKNESLRTRRIRGIATVLYLIVLFCFFFTISGQVHSRAR